MLLMWTVLVSLVLGILCGMRVSVFSFILFALIGALGSIVVLMSGGYEIGFSLLVALSITLALQLGYVIGLIRLFSVSRGGMAGKARAGRLKPKMDYYPY